MAPRRPEPELVLGSGAATVLLLLPGFMASPASYRRLAEPLARGAAPVCVRIPRLYPRGPAALLGRHLVVDEAAAAADRAEELHRGGARVWLAGHSRGGYAAWLAAGRAPVAGLVLIDPVAGGGRRPRPGDSLTPMRLPCPVLVIGAGIGGPCAPEPVNHAAFARAADRRGYAVLPDCGHADMLDDRARRLGRRLCGGGSAPSAARDAVTALLRAAIDGRLDARLRTPAGQTSAEPDCGWPAAVVWQ